MPLGKFAAIAAAAVLTPIALMVAFDDGEQAATTPAPQPAAAPLSERPRATTTATTTEATPERLNEAKSASTTPKTPEPKAFFQLQAEEKPRPVSPKPAPVPVSSGGGGDRDCADFGSQAGAQRFFIANGGPSSDPHRLDRDHDGIACENN
jgi:hypothetical protein